MSYRDDLKDPRWQKKRLKIMERDDFACRDCGDKKTELNVHHLRYIRGHKPWEYDDEDLKTLCRPCHENNHRLRRPSQPTPLSAMDFESFVEPMHGFYQLAGDTWHCACGCGASMSRQEFQIASPAPRTAGVITLTRNHPTKGN